jgi:hypothetical protein
MKGSEWNKWDLHIHSPMTWLNNNFGQNKSVPDFVTKLVTGRIVRYWTDKLLFLRRE